MSSKRWLGEIWLILGSTSTCGLDDPMGHPVFHLHARGLGVHTNTGLGAVCTGLAILQGAWGKKGRRPGRGPRAVAGLGRHLTLSHRV